MRAARPARRSGIDAPPYCERTVAIPSLARNGDPPGRGLLRFARNDVGRSMTLYAWPAPLKAPRMIPPALLDDAAALLDACRARGVRLATAESCTGGLIAAALTAIAGASDVVDRGFVTYSNEAKTELVGVPHRSDRPPRRGQRRSRARHGRGRLGPLARHHRGVGDRRRRPGWRQCGESRWAWCASASRSAAARSPASTGSFPATAPPSGLPRWRTPSP